MPHLPSQFSCWGDDLVLCECLSTLSLKYLPVFCLKNAFGWEHKLEQHQIFIWVSMVVIFQAS